MDNILQNLARNQIVVLEMPRAKEKDMLLFVSDLACRGSLRVVDGGNHFNVLSLSRMIRRKTSQVKKILNRIYISRAFTCIQMEAMLRGLTPDRGPVMVIDLLNTFYDESIDDQKSKHLLMNCVRHLKRLSHILPLMVSISPPPKLEMRPFLKTMLMEAADSAWYWKVEQTSQLQLTLWE